MVEDVGQFVMVQVFECGVDVVFVVGGDGMVCVVLEVIVGMGVLFVILLSGIGNFLVCNFGLLFGDLDEMICVVFGEFWYLIDIGWVCIMCEDGMEFEYVFVVFVGIGLDVDMIVNI